MNEGNLSFEDAGKEQSKLVNELRGKIQAEKRSFLSNLVLFLSSRKRS